MSVYNGTPYLTDAIDSILEQSFSDFEFLIIDDGSTDSSVDIIESYEDKRIRLIRNEYNLGLTKSLNKGLDAARGEFVARMDADDVAAPDRLSLQVAFMEAHPEIAVAGTFIKAVDESGEEIRRYPTSHSLIVLHMLFENAMAHPSTILRKEIFDQHGLRYDESLTIAQDYDLWYRTAQYSHLANINKVLLEYREHEHQVSRNSQQIVFSIKNRERIAKDLGFRNSRFLSYHQTFLYAKVRRGRRNWFKYIYWFIYLWVRTFWLVDVSAKDMMMIFYFRYQEVSRPHLLLKMFNKIVESFWDTDELENEMFKTPVKIK